MPITPEHQLEQLVVLKFGSSVLGDVSGLQKAATEVSRWTTEGHSVIAVVSAIAGTTDELVRMIDAISTTPDPRAVATVLATGEDAAASLFGIAVRGEGIECTVVRGAVHRLRTEGDRLNADPVDVDVQWMRDRLREADVVVVPGFIGRDANGDPTLLGRGGSDLTAVFLAHRLAAQSCRLIKDVDGVYEWDPNHGHRPPPRRFKSATWTDTLSFGDGLVQPKALNFARTNGQLVTVAGIGGTGTLIGPGPREFYECVNGHVYPTVGVT